MGAVDSTCNATAFHNHNRNSVACKCFEPHDNIDFNGTMVWKLFVLSSFVSGRARTTNDRSLCHTNRSGPSVDLNPWAGRTFRRAYSIRKLCSNAYIVIATHQRCRLSVFFIVIMIDWSMFWGHCAATSSLTALSRMEMGKSQSHHSTCAWFSKWQLCVSLKHSECSPSICVSILLTHRHFGLVPTNQPFTYGYYDEWQ